MSADGAVHPRRVSVRRRQRLRRLERRGGLCRWVPWAQGEGGMGVEGGCVSEAEGVKATEGEWVS